MTALCGGGASASRPGFGAAVSVGVAQLAALLNNVPTQVAFALAGYLGLVAYELSTFCGTDPPAMPAITAGDWVAALTLSDPVAHIAALSKFLDMFANLLWPTFCECTSTTTPATPALPTPPSNLPSVEPTSIPTAPTVTPCWHGFQSIKPTVAGAVPWNSFQIMFNDSGTHGNTLVRDLPTPLPTKITVTFTCDGAGSNAAPTISLGLKTTNASGATVDSAGTLFVATPTTQTLSLVPSATAVHFEVDPFTGAAPSPSLPYTSTFTLDVQMLCAGQSASTPASPCCPPDQSQQALLQSILSYVQGLWSSSSTPTSYADATSHAGLVGNGTITLVGAPLAVRVDITTDPTNLGESSGNPVYLFDRGYIVPVVNTAPIHGINRLVFSPQMFVLPPLTEQIGYSLHPGVTVTITELVRGP